MQRTFCFDAEEDAAIIKAIEFYQEAVEEGCTVSRYDEGYKLTDYVYNPRTGERAPNMKMSRNVTLTFFEDGERENL